MAASITRRFRVLTEFGTAGSRHSSPRLRALHPKVMDAWKRPSSVDSGVSEKLALLDVDVSVQSHATKVSVPRLPLLRKESVHLHSTDIHNVLELDAPAILSIPRPIAAVLAHLAAQER